MKLYGHSFGEYEYLDGVMMGCEVRTKPYPNGNTLAYCDESHLPLFSQSAELRDLNLRFPASKTGGDGQTPLHAEDPALAGC
jgi:hypothetical protein